MNNDQRNNIRRTFCEAWKKYRLNEPLDPLEQQLIPIILQHPEYQPVLENAEQALTTEFSLMDNPFFHMGMHLTILEQVSTDRPMGIRQLYETLIKQEGNVFAAEHLMLNVILENLWEAHSTNVPVSDSVYLERLKKLLK